MSFGRTRFISQNQFEQKWNNKLLRRTWSITTMRPAFRNLPQICQRWWIETFLPPFSVCSFLKIRVFFSKKWKGSKPLRLTKSQCRTAVTSKISCFFGSWSWKTPIPSMGLVCLPTFTIKKTNHSCRQIYRPHGSCGWIDSRNSILSTWPMVPQFFETDPEPWLWAKMAGQVWLGIP